MNPNWNHIVREHLAVLRLPPEREIEIVEEQALHLEATYEDALADGLSEAEAEWKPPTKTRSPLACRKRKPRRARCGVTTGACSNVNWASRNGLWLCGV